MPRQKKFDETEVLRKAKEVFWQKGFNGTSMDDLVQATGLNRSSIYDTFGDKHGLFVRTIQLYSQEEQNALCTALKADWSPTRKIRWLFSNIISQILNDTCRKGCFNINVVTEMAGQDRELAELVSGNMARVENQIHSWVMEGQASGEISSRFTSCSLASHFMNSIYGLRITGQTRPDRAALESIAETALSVLE